MAILKGFPPSNCISPTTRITEHDLSQMSSGGLAEARAKFEGYAEKFKVAPARPLTKAEQKRYHGGNVWVQRKEFGKSYQFDIEAMFSRMASFGTSMGVGQSLMKELVQIVLNAHDEFFASGMNNPAKMLSSGVTWFVWSEYHLIRELSVRFQTDLRPVWLKTWEGNDVPWVQERMKEPLNLKPPLKVKTLNIQPDLF